MYQYISRQRLSEQATVYYMSRLVDALHNMHKKNNLSHRDLKPENFLLDLNFDIKLADFGFCTQIVTKVSQSADSSKLHYTCRGTLSYMAPEVLDEQYCQTSGYNPELSDVFSLGVILFSMLMGKPPFRQANPRKDELYSLLYSQNYAQFWQLWEAQYAHPNGVTISKDFKALFCAMTAHNPYLRAQISEVKYSPFLQRECDEVAAKAEMKEIY